MATEPKKRGRPPKPEEVEGENILDAGKELVKRRNSPVIGDNGLYVKPGDNSLFLNHGLAVMNLPPINLENAEEIERRINEYFKLCADYDVKPTVSGLGMALGLDRRRLWEIKADVEGRNTKLTPRGRDAIKKAYNFLELLWEDYMLNYKIHPTAGIFLGKNNFGYKDEQTYNLVPCQPLGSDGDPSTLAQKYQETLPIPEIDAKDPSDS